MEGLLIRLKRLRGVQEVEESSIRTSTSYVGLLFIYHSVNPVALALAD
jgi:hypothetical protein